MSASVVAPYTAGSRVPSKFKLGPLSSSSFFAMLNRHFARKTGILPPTLRVGKRYKFAGK
jgi:hypothetical protein